MDKLIRGEPLLRAVLESLFDGVGAVEPSGRVLFVNSAMARMLGYPDAQSLPRLDLHDVLARVEARDERGQLLPFEQRPLVRALRGEAVVDMPLTMSIPARGLQYPAINSALPIFDENGAVRLAVLRMRDVSEQRKAMLALRRSEDRYHLATLAIEAMIFDWDVRTGKVERTEALQRILGLQLGDSEPTVAWWRARIHPEDAGQVVPKIERDLADRKSLLSSEYRIRHRDGHWVTVVDRGLAIYDETSGAPLRVVGSTVDVTRERQAQRALHESDTRFAKVFQLVPIAVAISTLEEGRFLDVNKAVLEMTGYTRDEMIGQKTTDLGVWAEPTDFRRVRQSLQEGQAIEGEEYRLRGKSGNIITSLISADVIELSGERCLVSAAIDITERKRAELALAESEQRYRALFHNASDIVAILDLDFRIVSINAAVERVLGYAPESVIGTKVSEYIAFDEGGRSGSGAYEVRVLTRQGRTTIALEVTASILRNEAGDPIGLNVIARDITERKQAEAHQAVLMRELQHRTKNILAVVQSLVTNTLRSSTSLAQANEALIGRLHAVATAQEFVTAEGGGGAPLLTLVEGELAAFPGRVRIDGEPLIVGNTFAQTFTLVVHELATNAAKYGALSTPTGHVDLRWSVEEGPDGPEFHFTWREKGGPPVQPPRSAGFGRKIIGLLGQPILQFVPEGLRYSLTVPMADLAP